MASNSKLEAQMKKTVDFFLQSFAGSWEAGATLDMRTPDCTHQMLPASLGFPKKNNEEWAEHFAGVAPLVTDGTMVMKEYFASPAEKRATAYSVMDSKTIVGDYHNEYAWFFRFNEDGTKFTEIVEFFDSKAVSEILGKVQAMKEKEGQ